MAIAFANVHHQGRPLIRRGIAHEFRQFRNQFDRKIVDRVVSKVFQGA